MNGYLIKATYLTGPHKGKQYLLRKGGYVTEPGRIEWDDTTYRTLGIAQAQCRRMQENAEDEYRFERNQFYRRLFDYLEKVADIQALSRMPIRPYFIYELMSYEPVLVSEVHKLGI